MAKSPFKSFLNKVYNKVESSIGKKLIGKGADETLQKEVERTAQSFYDVGITDAKTAARYYQEGITDSGYAKKLFNFENRAAEIGITDTKQLRSVFDRHGLSEEISDEAFSLRSNYALGELSPEFQAQLNREQKLARVGAGPKNAHRYDNYEEGPANLVNPEENAQRAAQKKVDQVSQNTQAEQYRAIAQDNEAINDYTYSAAEEQDRLINNQVKQNARAAALDQDAILDEPISANASQGTQLRTNQTSNTITSTQPASTNRLKGNRDRYNQEVSDTRQMLSQGTITRSEAKQRFTKARAARDKQIKLENLQKEVNEFNYEDPKYNDLFKKQGINTGTPWSSTAKAALGTAVVGAGICAALSSSRGQQNNAQLYGQQPLY